MSSWFKEGALKVLFYLLLHAVVPFPFNCSIFWSIFWRVSHWCNSFFGSKRLRACSYSSFFSFITFFPSETIKNASTESTDGAEG